MGTGGDDMRFATIFSFSILMSSGMFGCTGGAGKGGVGVDDITVSDCLSERPKLPGTGPAEDGATADTAGAESVLTAVAAGAGSVSVAHDNYSATCCVGFDVSASADSATSTVTVTYEETGEPCDCLCTYNLAYTLTDLSAGDWTISAGGDSTTVTVE